MIQTTFIVNFIIQYLELNFDIKEHVKSKEHLLSEPFSSVRQIIINVHKLEYIVDYFYVVQVNAK